MGWPGYCITTYHIGKVVLSYTITGKRYEYELRTYPLGIGFVFVFFSKRGIIMNIQGLTRVFGNMQNEK